MLLRHYTGGFKPYSEPLKNMVWTLTATPDSPGIQPLTLQLLVPSLPLKADGCCSLVDEALEAGILALLYRAAGWLNGDDRASEACMVRY